MKIRNLHLCAGLDGLGVMYLAPATVGTWHFAIAWHNPALQFGWISRRGFNGYLWAIHKGGVWRKG